MKCKKKKEEIFGWKLSEVFMPEQIKSFLLMKLERRKKRVQFFFFFCYCNSWMLSNLISLIPKYAEMIRKSGGYHGNTISILFNDYLCVN